MTGQPVGPGGGPLRKVAGAVLEVLEDEEEEEEEDDGDDEETQVLDWDERIKRSALFLTRKKRPDCPLLLSFRPLSQTNISVKTASVASKTVVADTKTAPAAPAPELITDDDVLSTIKSSIFVLLLLEERKKKTNKQNFVGQMIQVGSGLG